jgi:hypothetical protein
MLKTGISLAYVMKPYQKRSHFSFPAKIDDWGRQRQGNRRCIQKVLP